MATFIDRRLDGKNKSSVNRQRFIRRFKSQIKKAVTGYGQAEKTQVGIMIRALLRIDDDAMEEDASDALACAFCHLNTRLAKKNLEEMKI